MSDEVNLSITHPQVGLQARLSGEGLGLILRNVIKYLPAEEAEWLIILVFT